MKRSPEVLKALRDHYNLNVSLGLIYAQLSQQARSLAMPHFADYLKYLSDDKITIHKDLILEFLDRIQETEKFKFEFQQLNDCSVLKTPKDLAEYLYKTEDDVRDIVRKNAKLFMDSDDYETYEFWTWYINDGLKDFGEIVAIRDLFNTSNNIIEIDRGIKKILKTAKKD